MLCKCIGLKKENEPEIYNAIKRGAVLENVILNEDNSVDYEDISITHNTRCAYPLDHLDNVQQYLQQLTLILKYCITCL